MMFGQAHNDIKLLSDAWNKSWDALTLNRTQIQSQGSTTRLWSLNNSRHKSSQISLWAFLDLPRINRVTERIQDIRASILGLLDVMPSPHAPLNGREFRILRLLPGGPEEAIRCRLINTSVETPSNEYSAFSYCWGSASQPRKIIILNGCPFAVSCTVHTLLESFRNRAEEHHWIDALCIRQDDVLEKNVQIPLMGQIYSAASYVNIWLGPDVDGVGCIFNSLAEQGAVALLQSRGLSGISQLLHNQWFQRVWIVQELLLSRPGAPILNLGHHHINWERFATAVKFLIRSSAIFNERIASSISVDMFDASPEDQLPQLTDQWFRSVDTASDHVHAHGKAISAIANTPIKKLIQHREIYWQDLSGCPVNSNSRPFSLSAALAMIAPFTATDVRDKVYGILGMTASGMHSTIAVDYGKTVPQVFLDATISILTPHPTKASIALFSRFPLLSVTGCCEEGYPSWTLDLSCQKGCGMLRSFDHEEAAHIDYGTMQQSLLEVDLRTLELRTTASVVDSIIRIFKCSQEFSPYLQDADWSEQKITGIRDVLRCLRNAQIWYDTTQDATQSWTSGAREPLWQLFYLSAGLPVPSQDSTMREYAEKFDVLVGRKPVPRKHLLSIPNVGAKNSHAASVYRYGEPLSSQIASIISANEYPPSSFFITSQGFCGLCNYGAQVGDTLAVLFRGGADSPGIPFVIRDINHNLYSTVAVAGIPKSWEDIARYRGTFDPREIAIK
jgi:hypothetical protein